MEDKIKNFDRSIEQAMNEGSVTPPFGMWNRISAELDVPVAATAAAGGGSSIGSILSSAAIIGLVTAALVETAFMIGYVVNNNSATTQNIATITAPVQQTPVVATVTIPQVKQEEVTVIPAQKIATTTHKVKVAAIIAKPVDTNAPVAQETTAVQPDLNTLAANSDVSVPLSTSSANTVTDAYYFPPVDNDMPEHKVAEKEVVQTTVAKTDGDEKKVKSSGASEQKIKFHPAKHHPWSYGGGKKKKSL